ncbi:TOMM20-like protein 1 isoform X2 [Hemicordylus capensis]|uniref:TOMM20-like protein 1 isoform X2 n=1 Tax=Hemicordylus capensis TaxID=884348 RepID=UPI002303CD36|nr:TOMM20-like protein 1 isoform X2 [Hemicordylus capensis]
MRGLLLPPPRPLLLWLLAGAACGLALLAYCVYFDRKRRGAPDFPRRQREKRRKKLEKAEECDTELRELKDTAKIQEFFLQEIQLGELWLDQGEHKKSIEHLTNAISVCTHPNELMRVFEQTLPPQVFEILVHRIPYVMQLTGFPPSLSGWRQN